MKSEKTHFNSFILPSYPAEQIASGLAYEIIVLMSLSYYDNTVSNEQADFRKVLYHIQHTLIPWRGLLSLPVLFFSFLQDSQAGVQFGTDGKWSSTCHLFQTVDKYRVV